MREIYCSDEGDQGLNEGDSSKLQKCVLYRGPDKLSVQLGIYPIRFL